MAVVAPCHAQRASVSEAKIVAQTFLGRDTTQTRNRVARVITEIDRNGNPLMHEVIMNDSTIVLVSGSKVTSPILATYKEATGIFETDNLPCGLSVLVDYYREAIAFVDKNNVRGETNNEWQSLLNGERIQSMRTSVGPLLSSRWGQSWSNDSTEQYAYNKYTPYGTGCLHCPAGCVAVAMGQVMNYYRHPIITYYPTGFSEQFDWCHMPNELTSTSPRFNHECESVSRLLFTCAENVDMIYGCNGSRSDNEKAKDALTSLFDYSDHAHMMRCPHNYLNLFIGSFLDTVELNLLLGWPVIMGACTKYDNCHSFICDGYNADNLYHFNWGWNGKYNGFYSFNFWGNIDAGDSIFTHDFDAIIYLRPTGNPTDDICDREMHLDDFYADFYSNSIVDEYTFPPYYNTPKTTTVLYSADALSSEDWRTIPAYTQNPVEYRAHKEIHLQDGFTAEYGCDFTATIDPCEECEERVVEDELIVETDDDFEECTPDMAAGRPSIATEGLREETVLYPNPTDGELTIGVDGEVQSIVIYNAMGRPIGGWKLHAITPDHVTLDINPLATGTYLLLITTSTGSRTAKFIKQ